MSIEKIRSFIEAGSNATRGKPNPHAKLEKQHLWKGDEVSYSGIHKWVSYNWGKPASCEECLSKAPQRYEWANISKEYKRIREDWLRLCVTCHRRMDARRKLSNGR